MSLRRLGKAVSVLAIVAATQTGCGTAERSGHDTASAPIAYPKTERGSVTETHFGVSVPDPYRWLEADPHSDAKVAAWIGEYGSPAKEVDFRVLRSYSPYHNVKAGTRYPAILVTTADADNRVVPAHSFKYAAALQAAGLGPKPRLLRVDRRAGHGAGKPTSKVIEEAADMLAFAAHWTGLKVADGPGDRK